MYQDVEQLTDERVVNGKNLDNFVSIRSVAEYLGVRVRELVEQFPDLEGRQAIRLGPARELIAEWEKS